MKHFTPAKVELVHHTLIIFGERFIASGLRQHLMKFQVQRKVTIGVPRPPDCAHAFENAAQPDELGGGPAACREPTDHPVQRGANFVNFVSLGGRHLADKHPAIFLGTHQPGLLQGAKRLTHRAARHAELARQINLVELGAGGDLA